MSRPRIAYVAGDPNGIGPELTAKLLSRAENVRAAEVIVFADPAAIAAGERVAGVKTLLGDGARLHPMDLGGERAITPGEATESGGRAALSALEAAARAALRGDVDGIVFAPLNKHALRLAGMTQEDELRLMQERFHVHGFVSEFNITGPLWTSRVTSHIPLRDVADALTVDGVVQAVEIVHRYLVASGRASPKIAVTGLNPHAGDGG
jgi:4-hydroxythreonine-4-phosphate dehydrogenase